jgi:5-methylcytosine-specific restriction enzyme A
MIADMLSRVAREYVYERAKSYTGSEFANFVRHDLAIEAKKHLIFWPFDLTVKASVGAGNWAAVPWLAFFDPLITETATKGFYVVFLINAQTEQIVLSLNQGTTAVYQDYGTARGKEILRRRAIDLADRVPEFAKHFSQATIDLNAPGSLPAGYEAGHAFGRVYEADSVTEQQISEDLEKMLYAYEELVNRGGIAPIDLMQEESGSDDIVETRKYILSKRIERSNKVRRAVLSARNAICEACGLDPIRDYSYAGPPMQTPLDVHHSAPLNYLKEGESRRYRIPDDFLVLCPNCHRMIHKQDNPTDIDGLRSRVRFILLRESSLV